jgi:hypothetical protein
MNRRNFLQSLLAFSILPSAKTYKRIWKQTESGLVIPTYAPAGYEYPLAFTISDIPDPSPNMMRFYEHVVRIGRLT